MAVPIVLKLAGQQAAKGAVKRGLARAGAKGAGVASAYLAAKFGEAAVSRILGGQATPEELAQIKVDSPELYAQLALARAADYGIDYTNLRNTTMQDVADEADAMLLGIPSMLVGREGFADRVWDAGKAAWTAWGAPAVDNIGQWASDTANTIGGYVDEFGNWVSNIFTPAPSVGSGNEIYPSGLNSIAFRVPASQAPSGNLQRGDYFYDPLTNTVVENRIAPVTVTPPLRYAPYLGQRVPVTGGIIPQAYILSDDDDLPNSAGANPAAPSDPTADPSTTPADPTGGQVAPPADPPAAPPTTPPTTDTGQLPPVVTPADPVAVNPDYGGQSSSGSAEGSAEEESTEEESGAKPEDKPAEPAEEKPESSPENPNQVDPEKKKRFFDIFRRRKGKPEVKPGEQQGKKSLIERITAGIWETKGNNFGKGYHIRNLVRLGLPPTAYIFGPDWFSDASNEAIVEVGRKTGQAQAAADEAGENFQKAAKEAEEARKNARYGTSQDTTNTTSTSSPSELKTKMDSLIHAQEIMHNPNTPPEEVEKWQKWYQEEIRKNEESGNQNELQMYK